MPIDSEEPSEQTATRGLDVQATDTDTSWGFKGHNYLFTIAIDKYKYWHPLRCAVKDVQDFTKVLIDRYQFDEAFVIALVDEKATLQNILNAIRDLTE